MSRAETPTRLKEATSHSQTYLPCEAKMLQRLELKQCCRQKWVGRTGPTKSNWPRDVVRGQCGTVDIFAGVRDSREARGSAWHIRTSHGGPWRHLGHGFPGMSHGIPRSSLNCLDVPGAPRSFPGASLVSGRPRDFSRPPRAARTSQGLTRASLGRPDVPRGLPGPL